MFLNLLLDKFWIQMLKPHILNYSSEDNHIINQDCQDVEKRRPCILQKKAVFDRKEKHDLIFKAKTGLVTSKSKPKVFMIG